MWRHKIATCLSQRVKLIYIDVYSDSIASLDLVTGFFAAFGVALTFLGTSLMFICRVFKRLFFFILVEIDPSTLRCTFLPIMGFVLSR